MRSHPCLPIFGLAGLALALGAAAGCAAGNPLACSTNADCTKHAGTPVCNVAGSTCIAIPAPLLGYGDGSPSSVTLTTIASAGGMSRPVDLAFNPDRPNELWVVDHGNNSVFIVIDPGQATTSMARKRDPAAGHFMNKPPAIAFGAPGTFGTCGENGGNDPGFMGPTLFSHDPGIFAQPTPTGLGSHLDMLHDSPFCMGIAHERDNVYWVFDGENSSITRYDFAEDHGPGNDDHSDGTIYRYVEGAVKRTPGTPSHLQFNPADAHLYIADTGNARVIKLDTRSGAEGRSLPSNEPLVAHAAWDGATLTDVVPPGVLTRPSGLLLDRDILYVSDAATGRIHAFDLAGTALYTLDTGLGDGALAGLAVGPDGRLYFTDLTGVRVVRVDPIL